MLKFKFEIIFTFLLALLGLSIYSYKHITYNFSIQQFFPPHNSDTKFYNQFLETFNAQVDENALVIAIPGNSGIFNRIFLNKLDSLCKFLEAQDCISKVYSITNLNVIYFTNSEFNARPLVHLDRPDLYAQDSAYICASPEYYKLFISRDQKACALTSFFKTKLPVSEFSFFTDKLKNELFKLGLDQAHLISSQVIEQSIIQQFRQEGIKFLLIFSLFIMLSWIIIYKSIKTLIIPIATITISLIIVFACMTLFNYPITIFSSMLVILIIASGISAAVQLYPITTNVEESKLDHMFSFSKFQVERKAIVVATLIKVFCFFLLIVSGIKPLQIFGLCAGIGILLLLAMNLLMEYVIPLERAKILKKSTTDQWILFFNKFYEFLFKYKTNVLYATLILLVSSSFFICRVHLNSNFINDIPKNLSVTQDVDFISNKFGGNHPVELILTSKINNESFYELSTLKKADTLIRYLEDSCNIHLIRSAISLIKATNKAYQGGNPKDFQLPNDQTILNSYLQNILQTQYADDFRRYLSADGQQLRISGMSANNHGEEMQWLQNKIDQATTFKSFHIQQTGAAYAMNSIPKALIDNFLLVFLIGFILLLIVVWIPFKRLEIIPITMIPTLFSIAIMLGIMGIHGINLNAETVLLVFISFCISIDYSIQLMNRFKSELQNGLDKHSSIQLAFINGAKPLTINTLILTIGFICVLFSKFETSFNTALFLGLNTVLGFIGNAILLPILLSKYFNILNDNKSH